MNNSSMVLYVLTLFVIAATGWAYHTPIDIAIDARGMIRPDGDVIRIVTATRGRISELNAIEGGRVRKGDVLLQLDTRELDLNRRMLENRITIVQTRIANLRHSLAENIVIDTLSAELVDLHHQLEKNRIDLEGYTIASPAAGVISAVANLHSGEIVAQDTPIGTIIPDTDKRIVESWVPAGDRERVEVGQRVRLASESLNSVPSEAFDGTVVFISPDARITESRAVFRILIAPAVESPPLRSGLALRIHFVTGRERLLFLLFRRLRNVLV